MFLNQKQLREDIADIVMGEITRSESIPRSEWPDESRRPVQAHGLSRQHWRAADSEYWGAALSLSDRVAERILEQYMLVLPIEEEVTND